MIGELLRLAAMAGTSAGIGGLRHAGRRLERRILLTAALGVLGSAALGFFAFALLFAIAPAVGTAWALAIVGAAFVVVMLIAWLWCWVAAQRRIRRVLAAEAMAPSLLSGLDLPYFLERHAVGIMLAAFVAGMLMNRRR
jgi:hypothetical protein